MLLDRRLLNSSAELPSEPGDLFAVLNAHGLYSSLRFVVRLSPEVHRKLASLPDGVNLLSGVDFETTQAFSTYLHETIHWWQHIGSTVGLLMSLSHPAQTHSNINHLRRIVSELGTFKSLRRYAEAHPSPGDPRNPLSLPTIAVNNQSDIEFYQALATNPDRAEEIVRSPYFESMGHAFQIMYSNVLGMIASTFDPGLRHVPSPDDWSKELKPLRDRKIDGFYYGSPITLSPIGAYHIFEGQARFSQLQYLFFASNKKLTWDDVRDIGMLGSPYTEAFQAFLNLNDAAWPATIDDPLVGLFLAICDMASNPGEGYPLPIFSPETFISDVDPGQRFLGLCWASHVRCPEVKTMIRDYSGAEYEAVTQALSTALVTYPPRTVAAELSRWAREGDGFQALMKRHESLACDPKNLAVQLVFGHHLAFSLDKARHPEFFCWPGAHMVGENIIEDAAGMLSRHSPRFVDRRDDVTIVPVVRSGADESVIMESFQAFYAAQAVYDLTRQWIVQSGPFKYNYRWLQPAGSDAEAKAWADQEFHSAYGVWPDAFELL